MKKTMIMPLAIMAAGAVQAQEGIKASAELGVVATSGNTDTRTMNGKFAIKQERGNWRNSGSVEALNSASDDVTTAEKYLVNAKSDYKYSQRAYSFVLAEYEDDRFSGYDYRAKGLVGAGYRFIQKDNLTLDGEAGPGARRSKLDDDGTSHELIGRLAANLEWKISKTATFSEALSADMGEDATISKSVTALKAQVNGNLAMKVSLTVKNTSDVPEGVKETDTETAVTLVYDF